MRVRIQSKRIESTVVWSCRLGRFNRSWDLMNVRRGNPKGYAKAAELMAEFCSKMQQVCAKRTVTLDAACVTKQEESVTNDKPKNCDTLARAPAYAQTPSVTVSHAVTVALVTEHSDCHGSASTSTTCDSDSPTPGGSGPSQSRATLLALEKFKTDPRFSAWIAGQPADPKTI